VAILLYRVDERLIHGQVTVGWGRRLRPGRYVVVDDALASSPWEQEIHALGLPVDVRAEFVTSVEAAQRLPLWKEDDERTILLTRDLDHMVRLGAEGGLAGENVNLGGIHHAPGRTESLSYIFLDRPDEDRIRELVRGGTRVTAQDLPGSRAVEFPEHLS